MKLDEPGEPWVASRANWSFQAELEFCPRLTGLRWVCGGGLWPDIHNSWQVYDLLCRKGLHVVVTDLLVGEA